MDGEAGWWTTSGIIGLPPLARVMGVGRQQQQYTLMLYTCKALHDLAPVYLCELVVPYVPRRVLMSAELNLLTVSPWKPGKYGSRSFARDSANLWNSLRGERAAWLKNSPTLERIERNLKMFSSGNGSRVKQCYFLF